MIVNPHSLYIYREEGEGAGRGRVAGVGQVFRKIIQLHRFFRGGAALGLGLGVGFKLFQAL
jgi:hypothetical protein